MQYNEQKKVKLTFEGYVQLKALTTTVENRYNFDVDIVPTYFV